MLLYYPYQLWMRIGYALGWFNSRLILGIIFILVLIPISIVMKFFQYDPLKKKKQDTISYKENKKNTAIDLTRIF